MATANRNYEFSNIKKKKKSIHILSKNFEFESGIMIFFYTSLL